MQWTKARLMGGLIGGICLAGLATTASAQAQSTNRVAAETDWSVFVENEPKECWGVSAPKESVNTRDGRVVAVRRGGEQRQEQGQHRAYLRFVARRLRDMP